MRYLLIAVVAILSLNSYAGANAPETLSFTTSDGERIDGDFYSAPKTTGAVSEVIIFAPGFGQHRSAKSTRAICERLSQKLDTYCFDFRGTGTSTGL